MDAKIVLITGATSGIGEACAVAFAQQNWNIIITGRRMEKLQELKALLEKEYNIKCIALCFDIQNNKAVISNIKSLPTNWQNIDVLINNAGLALGRDTFDTAKMEDWEIMIDTNIKGLLYISKVVIELFKQHKKGHIINIGSVAAKEVYEKGNVYCATKHAVDAISKAQRIDLVQYGIKVTCIHPGAVETEFSLVRFKGDKKIANSIYDGFVPLVAKDIAEIIIYTANQPKHICINDLVVTCTQQASATLINKNS
jgi:3-hydroxy acid dehydrogenase / malonic semialdehyde reductase